jgi:hypothetical protein
MGGGLLMQEDGESVKSDWMSEKTDIHKERFCGMR